MKIGIIGAMDEEIELILEDMEVKNIIEKANMKFNEGILWGENVVLVRSGIGKVNAAACTQILIDCFNVDTIINVGVAGGVKNDIYPSDVVIADSLVQHDMDTTVFGDKIGQVPRMDVYDFKSDKKLVEKAKEATLKLKEIKCFVGRIVSGDEFISSKEKIQWIYDEFNAYACEMEGASIAQVSYLNKIPFVIIRSISDNANNGAHVEYEEFKAKAVKISYNILKNMFNIL